MDSVQHAHKSYPKASHEFRNFVQGITAAVRKDGIRQHLGQPYKSLFEAHLKAVEVSCAVQIKSFIRLVRSNEGLTSICNPFRRWTICLIPLFVRI